MEFYCALCHDSGWRPACGCPIYVLTVLGECERHPRVLGTVVYRQRYEACGCRESNEHYQRNLPKPRKLRGHER